MINPQSIIQRKSEDNIQNDEQSEEESHETRPESQVMVYKNMGSIKYKPLLNKAEPKIEFNQDRIDEIINKYKNVPVKNNKIDKQEVESRVESDFKLHLKERKKKMDEIKAYYDTEAQKIIQQSKDRMKQKEINFYGKEKANLMQKYKNPHLDEAFMKRVQDQKYKMENYVESTKPINIFKKKDIPPFKKDQSKRKLSLESSSEIFAENMDKFDESQLQLKTIIKI